MAAGSSGHAARLQAEAARGAARLADLLRQAAATLEHTVRLADREGSRRAEAGRRDAAAEEVRVARRAREAAERAR
jgi:hypothetical protein